MKASSLHRISEEHIKEGEWGSSEGASRFRQQLTHLRDHIQRGELGLCILNQTKSDSAPCAKILWSSPLVTAFSLNETITRALFVRRALCCGFAFHDIERLNCNV